MGWWWEILNLHFFLTTVWYLLPYIYFSKHWMTRTLYCQTLLHSHSDSSTEHLQLVVLFLLCPWPSSKQSKRTFPPTFTLIFVSWSKIVHFFPLRHTVLFSFCFIFLFYFSGILLDIQDQFQLTEESKFHEGRVFYCSLPISPLGILMFYSL